jgi:hypothetical protein
MKRIWDPLRKKMVALTPEERVRQWFIGVLKESMKVPEYMMMSEVSLKLGYKPFRADILVYGRDTAPSWWWNARGRKPPWTGRCWNRRLNTI